MNPARPIGSFRPLAVLLGGVVGLLAWPATPVGAAESERWLKVTAPEFTVVTTLREREAVAWANEFAQFVAALQGYITIDVRRLPRLTIVVLARERDFARFRPLRDDGKPMEVAGFFSRRASWAVAGLAGARMSPETRSTIFHEGTHWFLSGFELPNPVWLEEGLAEVYSTFAIEGKSVAWGRAIEPHVDVLRVVGRMPLERLLFLGRDSLHGEGEIASLRTGIAYAQSWAFVHYLIFGQRDVPKGALVRYVSGLRTAVHPDEAFRQAFGGTYAEIDRKLADYLQGGRYYVARQPVANLPPLQAEPAGVAEVEDALARLRMAGGRHVEARENVARVRAAAPDDPATHVLEGELAQESGETEAALAAYRRAIEKESRDFRPYFETASADHAAAIARDGSGQGLARTTAREIANRYERAINLNPRHRPAYQGLAGMINLVPAGNAEDTRFLEHGAKLFPDDGLIRLGLAIAVRREGNEERARALLASVTGATSAQPANVVAYARRLETEWEQRDLQTQVDALVKERKFEAALVVVDERIAAGVDFNTRQQLQVMRDSLHASHLLEEARVAMSERRIEDARAKYQAVLDSKASPIVKGQVRRYLEQLDRRAAGKKK